MFTLDIETIAWFKSDVHKNQIIHSRRDKRLKDSEKVQENIDKVLKDAALSPLTGEIVIIGIYGNGKYNMLTTNSELITLEKDRVDLICDSEKQMLKIAWDSIGDYINDDGELLVTWNGKEFDLPFMFMRSLILGVIPPAGLDYEGLIHKYRNYPHLDLRSFIPGSMDTVMATLGIEDKVMEGENIEKEWYKNPEKVMEKCINDLKRNSLLYERMKGWINIKMNLPVRF